MRKAIIVDDEKLIRLGIRNAIPWEKIGIDQVFLAASATEALRLIADNRPEIMITDINMPETTGLELIRLAREHVENMRIIMLTGYDDFTYVRDSLRLHVDDFFLKPVDEDELIKSLEKMVRQLEEENRQKVLATLSSASYHDKVEQVLRRMIHGKVTREEAEAFFARYGLRDDEPLKVLLLVPPVRLSARDDINLAEYEIREIAGGFVDASKGEFAFSDACGNVVMILKKGRDVQAFSARLRQIGSVLDMESRSPPQLIAGGTVGSYRNLAASYNDAMELKRESRREDGRGEKQTRKEPDIPEWRSDFEIFKRGMMAEGDSAIPVLGKYHAFVEKAKAWNLSAEAVGRCCFEIVTSLYYQRSQQSADPVGNLLDSFLVAIGNAERNDIFQLTECFIERLFQKTDAREADVVSKAKVLIHEHLAEGISVASIAEQLYVTPNYFSRLFKSVTGEGCNDYIVRIRIEQAENLLVNTNMKMGKISELVGYRDSNYFSLAFKKQTGLSPKQYREQHRTAQNGDNDG